VIVENALLFVQLPVMVNVELLKEMSSRNGNCKKRF